MSGFTYLGALVDCAPGKRPSEADAAALDMMRLFLIDMAAHREREREAKRRLPLTTPNVPEDWWDPDGSRRAADARLANPTHP